MAINQQELKLIISQALEGDGMQKAAQELQTLATKADETKAHLVNSFKAGELSAADFNTQVEKVDSELQAHARAVQTATQATHEQSGAHGRLSSAIGISREQMGFLTREMGQAAGVSGSLMTGINALTSDIGPLGIVTAGLGILFQEGAKQAAEFKKANEELAASMIAEKASAEEITAALVKQNQAHSMFGPEVMTYGYKELAKAMHDAAIAGAEGAGNAARMADYAASVDRAAKAAYDAGLAHFRLFDGVTAANSATVTFKDDLDYLNNAANGTAASIQRMVDATGNLNAVFGQGGNQRAAGQLDPVAVRNQNIRDNLKLQDDYWNKIDADQRKRDQDADAAARKTAAEAERNAKTLAEFQKQGAAVSQYAGEAGKHAYEVIAASALDASDKVRLLHEWEQQLPADVQQKINLYINTEGLASLMALFHVRGPRQSTGNQQGDEWDFTLGGENQSVRFDYERRYGQTAAANDAWQWDHRAELQQQGYTGPGQTPGSSAAAYAAANGFAPSAGGSGSVTNVYQLNLSTQKSQSNVVQDFKSLKSLAGANT